MVAVTLYSEAFELTGSSKYVAAKELGPVGEKKKKIQRPCGPRGIRSMILHHGRSNTEGNKPSKAPSQESFPEPNDKSRREVQ